MKNTSCSLIVFNDNHIGHILLIHEGVYNDNLCLPNLFVKEDENLLQYAKKIGKDCNIETHNEILAYVIEEKKNRTYVFICNTKDEPNENMGGWYLGNEKNINDLLDEPIDFRNDLIERFKNGFLLDGTREIIIKE